MIPKANVKQVVIEDCNKRRWVVYGKDEIGMSHQRKIYKSYNPALAHASMLMGYYQVGNITEVTR